MVRRNSAVSMAVADHSVTALSAMASQSTPLRPELCLYPAAWYTIPCARFRLRRLVGYFWRTFRGISAPFCSEFFTTSFFLVRIILPDFPRLGHGLGQDRKPAAQKLRRCKQRIAAFSHCCQRHSASGSFCVYAKIRRINTQFYIFIRIHTSWYNCTKKRKNRK